MPQHVSYQFLVSYSDYVHHCIISGSSACTTTTPGISIYYCLVQKDTVQNQVLFERVLSILVYTFFNYRFPTVRNRKYISLLKIFLALLPKRRGFFFRTFVENNKKLEIGKLCWQLFRLHIAYNIFRTLNCNMMNSVLYKRRHQ